MTGTVLLVFLTNKLTKEPGNPCGWSSLGKVTEVSKPSQSATCPYISRRICSARGRYGSANCDSQRLSNFLPSLKCHRSSFLLVGALLHESRFVNMSVILVCRVMLTPQKQDRVVKLGFQVLSRETTLLLRYNAGWSTRNQTAGGKSNAWLHRAHKIRATSVHEPTSLAHTLFVSQ
jgi:hypothetical protein